MSEATLSLFEDVPGWLVSPGTRLERAFAEFHRENPHIYRELRSRAFRLWQAGARRIGVAMIFEAMRYDAHVQSRGDEYKLNNSYRSLYARLLIHQHPELDHVIETRQRKERAHG